MASKKYFLLTAAITLFSFLASNAQENSTMYNGENYNYTDSSFVPSKRQAQQADFMNGQYNYPAKPRGQWEIGINGGMLNVSGDIRSKTIFNGAKKPFNTLGWGLTVRKAWGYVFSTRLQFIHGRAEGYNWQQSYGYTGHPTSPINAIYGSSPKAVNYNYMTKINELSLQMVASLNALRFHRAASPVNVYCFLGGGLLTYDTYTDLKDASGTVHDWTQANTGITGSNDNYNNRKPINKNLRANVLDGNFETKAENHDNRGKFLNGTLRPVGTFGAGVQVRLSKKLTLQVEDKATLTMDDLVDGQRWQEPSRDLTTGSWISSQMSRDFDNINYLSVGLNLNVGNRSTLPLWWMNPMDYAYRAVKQPQAAVGSKCDKDADGDGISDCFDRCPNTPGGVSVDSHGCPFDTDGDGVADYKDKQLITPTECQPVDADGVGKCPDPACCTGIVIKKDCGSIAGGSVDFGSGSAKLSSGAMAQLNSLATAMRANPNCKAVIVGNGSGSKIEQQRSWDRANSVINYMVDKQGIDRERFIFQYGGTGSASSVDFRSAGNGEEGPSNIPPPFPNLRKN